MRTTFLAFLLALLPLPALAYIGPGVGIGAIGALVAVAVAVVLIVAGFVWFPVKRALKKRRAAALKDA